MRTGIHAGKSAALRAAGSITRIAASTTSSRHGRPISCTPIGNPALSRSASIAVLCTTSDDFWRPPSSPLRTRCAAARHD
jgi:hypothetical protein